MTLQRLKKPHTPFLFVLFSKEPLKVTWADAGPSVARQDVVAICNT